jgi:DNA-directed RNA polymerase beta subunit
MTQTFDYDSQYESMKSSVVEGIESVFPVQGKTKTLRLKSVEVDDSATMTIKDEKKAILGGKTVGAPVYGELELVDKDGKIIDKRRMKLATLPRVLSRVGSFLVRGKHYQVSNQLRLRGGVFTVEKENGEMKSLFNIQKGGRGRRLELDMNPESGLFKLKIDQGSVELYPILKAIGVSDTSMKKAWGNEIWAENKARSAQKMDRVAKRAASSLAGIKAKDFEGAGDGLKDFFDNAEVDPEVTEITLGKAYKTLSGDALVASSKELLAVHKKEREPDDRDSLVFKAIHSVEDFLPERIRTNSTGILRKLRGRLDLDKAKRVQDVIAPATFAKPVETFFTNTDLSSTPDQTNPLDMISNQFGVTIMGEGGIQNAHAIGVGTRSIHSTHLGFIDPVHTPESDKVGASLHLPIGIVKDGNKLKSRVLRVKDKKRTTIDAKTFHSASVAFADQWDPSAKKFKSRSVRVMKNGKIEEVPASQVDYVLPSAKAVFGMATNLVPFLHNNNGNRVLMAAGMMTQAVPLKDREAPRVQSKTGTKQSFEQLIGEDFSFRSPVSGTVKRVSKDSVTIEDKKGKKHRIDLWDNFPLNSKAFLHHDLKVKTGDKIGEGDLIADSNYTSDGTLALGTNLSTAFVPYDGYNYEDGIVISESAAKKLTSEHMHKKSVSTNHPDVVLSRARFKGYFGSMLSAENEKKLNSEGVIEVGSNVEPGDILVAALRKKGLDQENMIWGRLSRTLVRPYSSSEAVVWDKDVGGVVTDVAKDKRGNVTVYVKTREPAQIGDKLSGRHGNKGIIVKIIPDEEAPKTKDGSPVDVLLNPHGVPSRINIGQIYETAIGKISDPKNPYIVNNFDTDDQLKKIKARLSRAGVKDTEELVDPRTGKKMRFVDPKTGATRDPFVGNQYFLKLYKQAGANFSARYQGNYDVNERPLKGGGGGGKAMDLLTFYSMLSHGARSNLQEMAVWKSNRNDEFWRAIESGRLPPSPNPTFAYKKLIEMIKATGVQVEKNGSALSLRPMRDSEVLKMSNGEIKRPRFMRAKDLLEDDDGLVGKKVTGGMGPSGTKWSHLSLAEAIPNPLFEDAIKKLTGLSKRDFESVVSGSMGVNGEGQLDRDGARGGAGIKRLLDSIDVDKDLSSAKREIKTARRDRLDNLNKKIRYLKTLKEHEMSPSEAYMMENVPVLPPIYRPIYPTPDGNLTISPVNWLYRDVGVVSAQLKDPVMDLLEDDDEEKVNLRADLYKSVKAVQGVGKPIKYYNPKKKGLLEEVKGARNKEGFFQAKVLSRTQELTGRGTIIPEPSLGVDQVALPEEMAWTLFRPFLMDELRKTGRSPADSKVDIDNRSVVARRALDAVMANRLVLLNRAPSLHKFSVMAFQPQITKGKAIKIPPLVVKGFNADFDGDAMSVHVPVLGAALKEARGMVPSKHLFNPRDNGIMLSPGQEALTGLYLLSQSKDGIKSINAILPDGFDISGELDKGGMGDLMSRLAADHSKDYGKVIDKLKRLGDSHATAIGFTVGLDDLDSEFDEKEGKAILDAARKEASKATTRQQKVAAYSKADKRLLAILEKKHQKSGNSFFTMLKSGGKGSWANSKQIMGIPGLFADARGHIIPVPVTKNFSHGLPFSQYWTSLYGARKGTIDRSLQTSKPGAFQKDLMASSISSVISAKDCGAGEGIVFDTDDQSVFDRYLAKKAGGYKAGTLVTPQVTAALKKGRVNSIEVRTPLRCQKPQGICATCFGLREGGQAPDIGDAIGALAGSAMAEPLTQMQMNTKHTGGVAGTGLDIGGFAAIDKLLKMPKTLAGKATLSDESGKVEKIGKAPAGGHYVYIAGTRHHVGKDNPLRVKAGDKVNRGDPLSSGLIRPQELLERKGLRETQEYLSNSLHDAYAGQGKQVKKRLIETVIRSVTNSTRVLDSAGSSLVPGDIVSWSMVDSINKRRRKTIPTSDAIGKRLGKDYGPMLEGYEVDDKMARQLGSLGYKEVEVDEAPIIHEPTIRGINQVPSTRKDWLSQMGYREIIKAIKEGGAQGWKSDIHDFSPIPAYAYGAEFGGGKRGAY